MNENLIAKWMRENAILVGNGYEYNKLCNDEGTPKKIGTPKVCKKRHALPRTDRTRVRIIHTIFIPRLGRPTRRRCFRSVEPRWR